MATVSVSMAVNCAEKSSGQQQLFEREQAETFPAAPEKQTELMKVAWRAEGGHVWGGVGAAEQPVDVKKGEIRG